MTKESRKHKRAGRAQAYQLLLPVSELLERSDRAEAGALFIQGHGASTIAHQLARSESQVRRWLREDRPLETAMAARELLRGQQ